MRGRQERDGQRLLRRGIETQARIDGERPPRRFAVAERKAADYIEDRPAAPDSLISPERKGELFQVMGTLISGVVEDPKMRRILLKGLLQHPENPYAKFLLKEARKQVKAEYKAAKLEGALKQTRRDVLRTLELRFGRPSKDTVKRINSIPSLRKLRALHGRAIVAPRIEAFLKALK